MGDLGKEGFVPGWRYVVLEGFGGLKGFALDRIHSKHVGRLCWKWEFGGKDLC